MYFSGLALYMFTLTVANLFIMQCNTIHIVKGFRTKQAKAGHSDFT